MDETTANRLAMSRLIDEVTGTIHTASEIVEFQIHMSNLASQKKEVDRLYKSEIEKLENARRSWLGLYETGTLQVCFKNGEFHDCQTSQPIPGLQRLEQAKESQQLTLNFKKEEDFE